MPASDLMDPKPVVLRDTDHIETAVEHIMGRRFRNLPVVDGEGRYLGVFGVNELMKLLLPLAVVMEHGLDSAPFVHGALRGMRSKYESLRGQSIGAHIDTQETVGPDTSTIDALLVLYHTRSSVPVVDPQHGRLLGVISYWDVTARMLELDA